MPWTRDRPAAGVARARGGGTRIDSGISDVPSDAAWLAPVDAA